MEHKEVLEQVKKEIKSVGATSKENFEELNRKFEEFKKRSDDTDPITKEMLDKIATDVSLRQDEADKASAVREADRKREMDELSAKFDESGKKLGDRLDAFETAMKRVNEISSQAPEGSKEIEAEHLNLQMAAATVKGKPLTVRQVMELKGDFKAYEAYKSAFRNFLMAPNLHSLSPEDQKALSIGSEPDGGVTVPTIMSDMIFSRVFESDPIRQLANVERTSGSQLDFLADVDEADDGWEDEITATANTGTPQFNKISIPIHFQRARPRITQALIEDSALDIESWLAQKIGDKFARTQGAAFVNGATPTRPRGILTYDDWTTAGTYEFGKVERQNMGAAAALTTDGLINVKYRLVEFYLTRATWLANRLTIRDIMKLKDGDGQYVWRPGLQEGQPSLLLGLPLRMSTTMPVVAANALSIAIGDWQRAYTIVDRIGLTIQRDPYTVKPFIEFYARQRVGGAVTDFQALKIGVVAA